MILRASRPLTSRAALLGTAVLLLTGCTSQNPAEQAESSSEGYPAVVRNCGEDITFDAPPERVVALESAPVTILDELGLFDRVVARAGAFPHEYYDPDLVRKIEQVPALSEDINASGHIMISQEAVIAQHPDLVLGLPDGVSRSGLSSAGANALVQEVFCEGGGGKASFDMLYDEIERYGEIWQRQDAAHQVVGDLKARVAAITEANAHREDRTAAVLYSSAEGGPLYAYGTASMAQPQLEALGLENVFEDSDERVFEVQTEQLVSKNPDVLVVLYQGDQAGVEESVSKLPGAREMNAVKNHRVITQLFNFTEPASPLTVEGLARLDEQLNDGRRN